MLPIPDPPLADDVVALRPGREDDVPARVMGFADGSVLRWSWASSETYTENDARDFFARQHNLRALGRALNLAFAAPGAADDVLGGGSVYDIDPVHQRAAVGYWLAPHARGRGIATHATWLMARWAFDVLGTERLQLTCAPDNSPSQRVAERCGFTREALLRSDIAFKGGRRDTVMFSLLAHELGPPLRPAQQSVK